MEQITIHFHGGTTAVANIDDEEDFAIEGERLAVNFPREQPPGDLEAYVESVMSIPPRPRWCWIGDAYVFTQAVCGFECAGNTTGAN